MDLDRLRDDYFHDRFDAVVKSLRSGWPNLGLPDKTDEWAEACHLGMMSSFHLANDSMKQNDVNQERHWVAEAELWRARSVSCAIHSGNFSAGVQSIVALAGLAEYEKCWGLAADIANLALDLLDVAEQMNYFASPMNTNPPLPEIRRICHEQHARFLCDAIRKENVRATLDKAIDECRLALRYCEEDETAGVRARVKVKGLLANMTYWKGNKDDSIKLTEEVLCEAKSENLDNFSSIAEINLKKMKEGNDDLDPYQVA